MRPSGEIGTAERDAIDRQVLEWIDDPSWENDENRFDQLACRIFAFQFEACSAYARFCKARGVQPDSIQNWRDIPAVPTGAFKEIALRCFPEPSTKKTFRTSGTSTERRGELHLDTLTLYEASLWTAIKRFLFPDVRGDDRMSVRILAPAGDEQPDSSLSYMFDQLLKRIGDANSGHDIVGGELRISALLRALELATEARRPVALCGTAFSFVHLVDALKHEATPRLKLPEGSRIMETGGFKGKSREMSRLDLYHSLESALGIPPTRIVNQYGMTELGSQFYDSVLRHPGQPRRKFAPPWTRVRFLDPETGQEAVAGEPGIVVVHDLSNTGSIAAVQTADLGRQIGDGFEVESRIPDAEARGCSIAADTMLLETSGP